ncbi:MAG: hypothetical protein ACOYEW_10885 [Anaerolineae bacterium]|jgi:hypothetical protein
MLRNVDDLYGFTVRVAGADAGEVADFLFSDTDLAIRYVVVDAGTWLTGKRVLIGTEALQPLSKGMWEEKTLVAAVTKEQIEGAPDLGSIPPLSAEQEDELRAHYGWSRYWVGFPLGEPLGTGGVTQYPAPTVAIQREMEHAQAHAEMDKAAAEGQVRRPTLRSTKEVAGYTAQATNGEIGRVASFLVDDANWAIQYIIVDTTAWRRGGHVMVPVGALESIRWSTADVFFRVTRDKIRNAPEYDRARWSNVENIRRVQQYYGFLPDRDI